ncbi:MAG: alpha/beta fold hydrolase [Nocardioidaceae bacterium]|jgi:pimeloyl-ACP methyl ester carboxylesterase|nr:alpha/beta fold hydrolase [Nocardioidaceae bacterium]
MRTFPLPFFSDGHRLDGDLHLPDDGGAGAPYPIVITASGYQGLKVIHPERFARALTPRGYAVLAFDYRGFGLSEGERGRLVAQEWVLDVRAAVDRVFCHPQLDPERVALVGWGLGGGVVVAEAAEDPRVKVLACCNGLADGYRSTKQMHDDASWNSLLDRIEADRERRTTLGRSEITGPWDIVRLDLDARTDDYVGEELYKAPGFGAGITLESADYLLRFRPEGEAVKLHDQPLLIVHGADNQLHKVEEAYAMHAAAADPKQLEILDGKGHTEWMFDEDPTFVHMTEVIDKFFADALHNRT